MVSHKWLFCETNWPSLWSYCFGFITNFVFVTLCDVANISNIYIYIYIYMNLWILSLSFYVMWLILVIYINLCLFVCDYFGFRFFLFFSWCIELRNMEIMKLFFLFLICRSWVSAFCRHFYNIKYLRNIYFICSILLNMK